MADETMLPKRYINNDLLKYITWPQYKNGCSLATLTCVFNYLFHEVTGILSPVDIGKIIGRDPRKMGSPGDSQLIKYFKSICEAKEVRGLARMAFRNSAKSKILTAEIDSAICRKDSILAYHIAGHYLLVAGYYDGSNRPEEVLVKKPNDRYYIFADHLPDEQSTIKSIFAHIAKIHPDGNLYLPGPLLCRRWGDVWNGFRHNEECFIEFCRA